MTLTTHVVRMRSTLPSDDICFEKKQGNWKYNKMSCSVKRYHMIDRPVVFKKGVQFALFVQTSMFFLGCIGLEIIGVINGLFQVMQAQEE